MDCLFRSQNYLSKPRLRTFCQMVFCEQMFSVAVWTANKTIYILTSMHSSRMHTSRLLTYPGRSASREGLNVGVCLGGLHLGGLHPGEGLPRGSASRGICLGGLLVGVCSGGVCIQGGLPTPPQDCLRGRGVGQAPSPLPREQNDWQDRCKNTTFPQLGLRVVIRSECSFCRMMKQF